jgi:hypothetical protein
MERRWTINTRNAMLKMMHDEMQGVPYIAVLSGAFGNSKNK